MIEEKPKRVRKAPTNPITPKKAKSLAKKLKKIRDDMKPFIDYGEAFVGSWKIQKGKRHWKSKSAFNNLEEAIEKLEEIT